MLNDRITAAKLVAEKLFALETAIDEALVCAADLTTATSQARRTARLSAVVGQDAVAKTGDAIAALYAAQDATLAAHGDFAEVRDQLGVPTKATGGMWKTVPQSAEADQKQETAQLRVA